MKIPEDAICLEIEKANPDSDHPLRTNVYDHRPDYNEGETVKEIELDKFFDILQHLKPENINLGVQKLPCIGDGSKKKLHIYVENQDLEDIL